MPNGQFQDPEHELVQPLFVRLGRRMDVRDGRRHRARRSQPGLQAFTVRPRPGGGLTSAKASLDSIHGPIVSDWRSSGNTFTLTVTVPVNTSAVVYLPYALTCARAANPRRRRAPTAVTRGVGHVRVHGDRSVIYLGTSKRSIMWSGNGPSYSISPAPLSS